MIKIEQKGEFDKTIKFLNFIYKRDFKHTLEQYAKEGVEVLAMATPKDTGVTAASWYYKIKYRKDSISIGWYNSSSTDQVPIVILLQYGHMTREGWFLQGKDFINPAIRPVFDELSEKIWREVVNA